MAAAWKQTTEHSEPERGVTKGREQGLGSLMAEVVAEPQRVEGVWRGSGLPLGPHSSVTLPRLPL